MDDSPIQTALCVIGHPIGGNPTQFVALRALAALGLDWQFISFDVDPGQIQSAISGVESLGFCGAMIANPYQRRVAELLSAAHGSQVASTDSNLWHDCLHRDDNQKLVASNLFAETLKRVIQSHVGPSGQGLPSCILIADEAKLAEIALPCLPVLPDLRMAVINATLLPWPPIEPAPLTIPELPTTEEAEGEVEIEADTPSPPSLVLWAIDTKPSKKPPAKPVAGSPSAAFVLELLSLLHPESLVIDFSGTASAWIAAQTEPNQRDIAVVNQVELELLRLGIAIQRWTGCEPNIDLMREAIEEYLEI